MNLFRFKSIALVAGAVLFSTLALAQTASCASRASAVAAQYDARVLSVSSIKSSGRAMCRITLLVKSKSGGPARKKTVVVAQ